MDLEVPMDFGTWGEEVACRHLQGKGYEILERNFRCRTGELDIVARIRNTICFVEVKSRKGMTTGLPSEAVTKEKQQHLRSAALFYLYSHPQKKNEFLRMDVIEILRIQDKTYLRHIENAF